jgi:hypothetical protein
LRLRAIKHLGIGGDPDEGRAEVLALESFNIAQIPPSAESTQVHIQLLYYVGCHPHRVDLSSIHAPTIAHLLSSVKSALDKSRQRAESEVMTTREALCNAMSLAAAHSNRVRSLAAVASAIPAELFLQLVGQHPDTMQRDLESALQDFQRAKSDYEAHCREVGVPAYATWNED